MKLSQLTAELQSLCHEGHSEKDVSIAILDAFYKIGDIHKVETGDEKHTVIHFVIDAEV